MWEQGGKEGGERGVWFHTRWTLSGKGQVKKRSNERESRLPLAGVPTPAIGSLNSRKGELILPLFGTPEYSCPFPERVHREATARFLGGGVVFS